MVCVYCHESKTTQSGNVPTDEYFPRDSWRREYCERGLIITGSCSVMRLQKLVEQWKPTGVPITFQLPTPDYFSSFRQEYI